MRFITTLTLLSLSLAIRAQDYSFPGEIQVKRTPAYVNAPGTHLFLIPPPGYGFIPYQSSLWDSSANLISVKEWEGSDFFSSKATYSRDALLRIADTIFYFAELRYNNYPAILAVFHNREVARSISFRLVFGDHDFVVGIVIHALAGDQTDISRVKAFLENIDYDKTVKIDAFDLAPFRMAKESTSFYLADTKSAHTMFSETRRVFYYKMKSDQKEALHDLPAIRVESKMLDSKIFPRDSVVAIAKTVLSDLQQNEFDQVSVVNSWTGQGNGMPVYQAELYGELNGKKALIYLFVASFGDGEAAVLEGIAYDNYPRWLAEFKQLSATIRPN